MYCCNHLLYFLNATKWCIDIILYYLCSMELHSSAPIVKHLIEEGVAMNGSQIVIS